MEVLMLSNAFYCSLCSPVSERAVVVCCHQQNRFSQLSSKTGSPLASCVINAQPLPAHSPAADDNSLIGCTSHEMTDDWSLASTHFGFRLSAFFY